MTNIIENKRRVLASNMWLKTNFGDPNDRYQKFLLRGRSEFSSFIQNSLLYDEVYVPTEDYLSLSILIGVLGESAVNLLVSNGTLKFIRIKGAICYCGNGVGVQSYKSAQKNLPHAYCSDIEYAVDWAINGLDIKINDKKLSQRIIDNSIEIDIDKIVKSIKVETIKDIYSSDDLKEKFSFHRCNLNKLSGIKSNEVRIYGGKDSDSWTGDRIDTLMLLNDTNLELKITEIANCTDMITSNPLGHILRSKFSREIGQDKNTAPMNILKEIADIPDFGEAILNKQVDFADLLELKLTKNGELFRNWFHEHCNGNEKEITKEFIKLIQETPKMNSLPVKILRYIISSGLGFIPGIGLLLGTGASMIDTFFLDKWTKGHSPKFFIDDLKQFK